MEDPVLEEDEEVSLGADLSDVVMVVNSLASAWTTFRLYPDPTSQPAFSQALERMAEGLSVPITFDVGPRSLIFANEEVTASRAGVEQLATRLFVHDVAEMTVLATPSSEELSNFFNLLALDDGTVRDEGGIAAMTEGLEVIRLRRRGALPDELELDEDFTEGTGLPARTSELATMVDEGATPDEVTKRLVEGAEGDEQVMTEKFVEAFRELHRDFPGAWSSDREMAEMFYPYWVDDLGPSPTGTFVEVFFRMPQAVQSEILKSFLSGSEPGADRMFLDQCSGAELAALAPLLGEEQLAALLAYARDATELPGGSREELFRLLRSTGEVRDARREFSEHASRLLQELEGHRPDPALADEIRAALKPDNVDDYGREVLRGLFATVTRQDRFQRLLRVWTGRVAVQVRHGSFGKAIDVIETVIKDPTYPSERNDVVHAALAKLVTRQLVNSVVSLAGSEEGETAIRFVQALGSAAGRKLLEQLADEEDAGRRRSLIDLLTVLGKKDPTPLIKALSDPRWYVVRNVAMVLGKTGQTSAIGGLKRAYRHEDARVRVEVLRALMPISPTEATTLLLNALEDENKRVRHAAVTLLKTSDSPDLDERLVTALEAGALAEETVLRVAEVLRERGTPRATEALRSLAGKKFSLKKSDRAVRNAARAALNKEDE